MKTRTFKMNDKTYTSMMDIAREIGIKRVYPRDFAKYGIVELTDSQDTADESTKVDDVVQEVKADVAETTKADETQKTETSEPVGKSDNNLNVNDTSKEEVKASDEAEEKNDNPQADDTKNSKAKTQKHVHKVGTAEEIQSVKDNVGSMTIQEFCEEVKHFTVSALLELAKHADPAMNTWDSITNEPIRKMRLTMELKKFYFPNDKLASAKPATGWKKMELNKMLEIADNNHVDYKKYDDEKIQRMWLTVALNKAGLNPQDYQNPKDKQEVANG